jgi:hypothetical protein
MNSDDRVLKALDALKHLDCELEAPPRVEAVLLETYRKRHSRRGILHGWFQGITIALLAAALVMAFALGRNSKAPTRPTIALQPAPATLPIEATPVLIEEAVIPQGTGRGGVQTSTRNPSAESVVRWVTGETKPIQPVIPSVRPQPREVVTDFFPLMDVAPPLGRGQILRVTVPASTMRSVGLPVREERLNDRVQADVLVGEEGMARAIRFVSFVQDF